MIIRLTRLARYDLFGIWDFIAETSERNANECIKRIREQLEPLEDFPEMGVRRSDIAPDIRMLVIERWIVLYGVEPDAVRVLRIVDGARDLSKLNLSDE